MIRVALRGLAGRKLRAFLTALAIVLGVAMVSGTFVLTDMIDRAFDDIFTQSYANTDAYISGKSPDFTFEGDQVAAPSIPASVLPTVKKLPEVQAAAGTVADDSVTKIIDRKGKPITTGGAPTFGFGLDYSAPQFNPLKLTSGDWPSKPDDVVIDSGTAADQNYKVGDTVKVATLEPVRPFKLVGIAQYGTVGSIGSATFATFTLPTAQELLHRKGQLDAVSVSAKPGVSQEQLVAQIKQVVPLNKVEVRTRAEQVKEAKKSASFTKIIKYFLLSFATIALFVGAFVIFNTLSITVSQRIREFATLRTIGASRRQLLTSVSIEAFVIGLLGAILGLLAGIGLAVGLNAFFKAVNSDLPTTGLIVAPRTIIVSLAIGVVVTLVAGLAPAVKATKVPPIAAVREGATLPRGRLAPFLPFIAIGLVALGVALLAYGMFANTLTTAVRLISLALGCLVLFIGVALLSPRLVPALSRIVRPIAKWVMLGVSVLVYPTRLGAWLFRRGLYTRGISVPRRIGDLVGGLLMLLVIGPGVLLAAAWVMRYLSSAIGWGFIVAVAVTEIVLVVWVLVWVIRRLRGRGFASDLPSVRFDPATDRLSGENTRRNPGRTAATAAALMIGLALVTFIAVLANGMKQSNRRAIERQVKSSYMLVSANGFDSISPTAGDAISKAPQVSVASNVRSGVGKASGSVQQITGLDPKTISQVYNFEWKDGSKASIDNLGSYSAIVDKAFADKKNLSVGSRFDLLTSNGKTVPLEVKGVYKAPPFYPLLGEVSISLPFFDQLYERPQNLYTFLDVKDGPNASTQAALEQELTNFPDAKVQTRDEWIHAQDKDFDNFLLLLYVLLALAVIVSLVGMINTLVLSVFERTRELGMLRAVGMTRNQVSRMVRQESVITALIGAALGLPLGVFLAALVTRALSQFNVEFLPPWKSLIGFAIVAMIAGVLAAVAPARRASRLNVLRALQYE
ncbi:MAG TPA: FtsX-like permease family protein [Gaiellaceae bacterium]|nr:FtsX-like permease family protein [Gaiellaceae bacterium]